MKLTLYALLLLAAVALNMIEPIFNSKFLDGIVYQASSNTILFAMGAVIIISLIRISISLISEVYTSRVKTRIAFEIVSSMVSHVQKLSLIVARKFDPAYLTSRISSDVNVVLGFFLGNFVSVFLTPLMLIITLFILIKINLVLAVVSLACIPIYIALYLLTKDPLARTRKAYVEKQNEFSGKITEELSFIEEIKTEGSYQRHIDKLREIFRGVFNSYTKALRINVVFSSIHSLFGLVFQLFNIIYGGYLVATGVFTIGQYTMVNVYFPYILNQLDYFLELGKTYQTAKVSYTRLYELLLLSEENNGDKNIGHISQIKLDSVSFRYQDNLPLVIHDLSATFEPGKLYSICGDNGSGKTTLINVLLNIYQDLESGQLSYNQVDSQEIDFYTSRAQRISVVRQQPRFQRLCVRALLEEHCGESSDVVQTLIREWGLARLYYNEQFDLEQVQAKNPSELSGGEQQKLALLIALCKNPDVLILDEPTSAMDQGSINTLMDFLNSYKKNHIVVCITHEPKLISASDSSIKLLGQSM